MIIQPRAALAAIAICNLNAARRILASGVALVAATVLMPRIADAQDTGEELLPSGGDWEYLLYAPDDGSGVFTPADPASVGADFYTTWQLGGAGYNGPAFSSGTAPLGYEVIDGAPNVTDIWEGRNGTVSPASGSRYTAYFRTTITPTTHTTDLRFTGITDDGAIIYINGVEVARTSTMDPTATDTWDLLAIATGSETAAVTLDVSGLSLPAGTAVTVAVSVHQQATTSSDMGMDFRITRPGQPAAGIIDSGTAGLAAPEYVITFSEHTFDDTAQVSLEFADLGVTFLPHLFYRVASSWEAQGINGANLRSGDPLINAFSIHFDRAVTSAAFASIASPVTPATITARLDGVDVASFSTEINLANNSWYGFTDIALDEIAIAYTAETRLRIDNIQLGSDANVLPFVITDIDVAESGESKSVTLTWQSRANRYYAVFASEDLQEWIELDDSVPSAGDETSFTEQAIPPGTTSRFYQVKDTAG